MNASSRIVCPKCHYLRKESDSETTPIWQCPSCGVVYNKYKHPSYQSKRSIKKKLLGLSIYSISSIAGVITFALLAIKAYISNIDLVSIMMVIILYISIIPILSVLFGDGLYVWDKNSMSFIAYDKSAHPILTSIAFILSLILSVMIIFLLFFKSFSI